MEITRTKYSGRAIVAICSLVYFASYFTRKGFAATMAAMISAGVIDKALGGFIGMGLFICYGAGQLISGYLGDKIKARDLIFIGLGLSCVCNLTMPLVTNTALMIPIWALNGLGQAMLWPPIVRMLSDSLDHERFVRANLLVTSAAHVATIILYLYVPVCLEFFEWKTVFFTASSLALVTILIFAVAMSILVKQSEGNAVEKSDTPTPVSTKMAEDFNIFIKRAIGAGFIPILVCIVMMGFLRDGIESWLPTLYSEAFGRDASESVLVSVLLPIFSMLSILVITVLHRNPLFGNEVRGSLVIFAAAAVTCIPLSILIGSDNAVIRIVCLVLAALVCGFMHAINFLLISCLPGRFSGMGRSATASGLCNACVYIGAAISMYGIAATSAFGWNVTVITWIGISAIGVVATLIALKAYTSFIKK